jgi:hypothetical protein
MILGIAASHDEASGKGSHRLARYAAKTWRRGSAFPEGNRRFRQATYIAAARQTGSMRGWPSRHGQQGKLPAGVGKIRVAYGGRGFYDRSMFSGLAGNDARWPLLSRRWRLPRIAGWRQRGRPFLWTANARLPMESRGEVSGMKKWANLAISPI